MNIQKHSDFILAAKDSSPNSNNKKNISYFLTNNNNSSLNSIHFKDNNLNKSNNTSNNMPSKKIMPDNSIKKISFNPTYNILNINNNDKLLYNSNYNIDSLNDINSLGNFNDSNENSLLSIQKCIDKTKQEIEELKLNNIYIGANTTKYKNNARNKRKIDPNILEKFNSISIETKDKSNSLFCYEDLNENERNLVDEYGIDKINIKFLLNEIIKKNNIIKKSTKLDDNITNDETDRKNDNYKNDYSKLKEEYSSLKITHEKICEQLNNEINNLKKDLIKEEKQKQFLINEYAKIKYKYIKNRELMKNNIMAIDNEVKEFKENYDNK